MIIVVRAGGAGTRLWPLSTSKLPKQFFPMVREKSTFELTIDRIAPLLSEGSSLLISTNTAFSKLAEQQSAKVKARFIFEPERKDTAAAVGLEAIYAYHADHEAIIASLGSDHVITNDAEFIRILKAGENFIAKHPEYLLEIGVMPTYPETGYGYIEMGNFIEEIDHQTCYEVRQFKEKPPLDQAKEFVKSGKFLWNANMFMWRADTILKLYEQHQPIMYERLMRIEQAIGTPHEHEVLKAEYVQMEKIVVDYAIIEKAPHMAVIPADIGWTDIGSFLALRDLLVRGDENLVQGSAKHIAIDTKQSVIFGSHKKVITTIGVENMAIIETENAILVCPLSRVQEIKKLVELLEKDEQTKLHI